jgi:hypothetical protein
MRPLRRSLQIAAWAAAIGLLAQLLFYDVGLGINFPIEIAALLLAGWAARDPARPRPRLADLWIPFAAIVLAAFVALRGDATLVGLDILGALALTGAAIASFGGMRVVEQPLAGIVMLGGRVAAWGLTAGVRVLGELRRAAPVGRRTSLNRATPILRGLFLAVPLLLLFVALFSAADAVFARAAGDLLDVDLGSLPGRLIVALIAGWIAAGLLGFVVAAEDREIDPSAVAAWNERPRLGSVEAVTILVALDALFAVFVVLQAAYLFGGQDTLEASGLTYADYARRGFFELLAVAFVVGGLVLALETFVARRGLAYLGSLIGLIGLTLVVLASAYLRLHLYQDAYGWTELRFYVLAAISWLAIGSLLAILTVITDRSRWLLHGMLAVSVIFGLAFNLIGPVRYIAERNVERAIHPELVAAGGETGFDVSYVALVLGDDAVTVLADALPNLPAAQEETAIQLLRIRATDLEHDARGRAWQAWNYSRARARDAASTAGMLVLR